METAIASILGGLWRWWDGRGYGPGAVRLAVSGLLALWIIWPLGWVWAVPLAGLWSVIWLPRQKQREELDDMLLRWAAPVGAFGIIIGAITLTVLPVIIMPAAGMIVATLVWYGATHPAPAAWPSWLDSSAIAEALSGAVAYGALALAV